jgi:hypothetical protein
MYPFLLHSLLCLFVALCILIPIPIFPRHSLATHPQERGLNL